MVNIKSPVTTTGAGIFSAFAASVCCITPAISLLAGSSSLAANFSWVEPARPYLIGLSMGVLAFAWYQKLKPVKATDKDCNCDTTKQPSFIQSKAFLGIITGFAIIMITFPLYAQLFYPKPGAQVAAIVAVDNKQEVKFTLEGMTCAGCEGTVNNELSKVPGVLEYNTSYAARSSLVTFDKSKVDVKSFQAAIHKTGYKVIDFEFINKKK